MKINLCYRATTIGSCAKRPIVSVFNYIGRMMSYVRKNVAAEIKQIKEYSFPDLTSQISEMPSVFVSRQKFFKIPDELGIKSTFAYTHLLEILKDGDKILTQNPEIRCSPAYLEQASPELRTNLEIATSLINETQKSIPYSPNFLSRASNDEDVPSSLSNTCETFGLRFIQSPLKRAEAIKKNKSGYCQDMCLVGLLDSMKKYPLLSIEPCCVRSKKNKDEDEGFLRAAHHFLVIGRVEASDPRDYKTWGNFCVICDPWAGICYPAAKVEKELYVELCSLGFLNFDTHVTSPYVRPFDPEKQLLSIYEVEGLRPAR